MCSETGLVGEKGHADLACKNICDSSSRAYEHLFDSKLWPSFLSSGCIMIFFLKKTNSKNTSDKEKFL